MKKIALIGTHGVRKTTHAYGIAHKLKELGYNADILKEIAKECPLPINEKTTEDAQRWILYTQMAKEIEAARNNPGYLICDRASIDNYAYYVAAFGNNKILDGVVEEHIKTYDTLFRVPTLSSKIDADGIRSTDPKFQKRLDEIVLALLKDFKITAYTFKDIDNAMEIIRKGF